MKRFLLVGLMTLSTVSSLSPGQHTFDCAEAYIVTCRTSCTGGLSPEDRAALQRWAFRAYNACETGNLENPNPKAAFEKLETEKRALKLALKLMGATKSSEKTAIY